MPSLLLIVRYAAYLVQLGQEDAVHIIQPLTLCPGKALWVSHSQLREPGSSVEAPHSAAWQCYRLTGTVLRDDVFVILHQNHVACYLKQEGVLHSFHQPGSCHLFSMHVWVWDLPFTRVTDK